jgi:hypothetical protein
VLAVVLGWFVCPRAQVLEVAQPNSGRDAFSSLLKKQRLVKEFKGVADVGTKPNPDAGDYYTVTDFFVGATINVYGRQFFIYAVDEYVTENHRLFESFLCLYVCIRRLFRVRPSYSILQFVFNPSTVVCALVSYRIVPDRIIRYTKEYFKTVHGQSDAHFPAVQVEAPKKVAPKIVVPPYNGINVLFFAMLYFGHHILLVCLVVIGFLVVVVSFDYNYMCVLCLLRLCVNVFSCHCVFFFLF